MNPLAPLKWLWLRIRPSKIRVGDPVRLNIGVNDPMAKEYDGHYGVVTDILNTARDQTVYAVDLREEDETIYVEEHKVEVL